MTASDPSPASQQASSEEKGSALAPDAGADAALTDDPVRFGPEPTSKAAAPDLSLRAPRPPVTRLRKSVVQTVVIGGAVLVSGALAWAFVVQPELRDGARMRATEARENEVRGVVRPAESVTDQPATYDRLPRPRIDAGPEPTGVNTTPVPPSATSHSGPSLPPVVRASSGPGARAQAARSRLFFEGGPAAASAASVTGQAHAAGQAVDQGGDLGTIYNGHTLTAPLSPYELKAGAIVPAVLLTGVDTSRPGPVVATVSQNVFDTVSGRHLVLPQGTRLIGRHEGDSAYGDRRAFLTWDRLILPNGKSLVLTGEPGVDAQGAVGVRGRVDRRLWPLLVGTMFAGAITTLGQIARDGGDDRAGASGLLGSAGDAAAIEGSQVGGRLVDRELQVRPSIRLRPGAAVRVMITRDLILEPYRP